MNWKKNIRGVIYWFTFLYILIIMPMIVIFNNNYTSFQEHILLFISMIIALLFCILIEFIQINANISNLKIENE